MVKSLVVAFAGLAIAEFSGGFALLPGEAEAGQTWRVENYGVDSSTCGMSAAPCRSITQAIANSSGGDIISVGPGRYGDLDGDGTLGNIPGEEVGCGGECLIDVRKRLTIRSTHGAGVTVLDAGRASLPDGVALLADGVVFGQQGSGFTITGLNTVPAECFGVALLVQGSNVSVGGNVVTGNTVLRGIEIQGRGNKIVGNLVSQNSVGDFGVLVSSDGNTMLTGNVASGNVGTGCFARPGGFFFHGEVVANGNAAVGNSLIGFMVDRFPAAPRSGQMLTKNVVAGNLGPGIFVVGNGNAAPLTLTQNNIYGNDSAGANCGVFNETGGNITVANNFWGAVTGPGGNPADDVCDGGGATTISTPFAAAPFAIPNGLAGK